MLGWGGQAQSALIQSIPAQSIPVQSAATPSSSDAAVPVVNIPQQVAAGQSVQENLPGTPGQQKADPQSGGSIHGTATDPNGNVVVGALVTLEIDDSKKQRTLLTDGAGAFDFTGLQAGTFRIAIASSGFADWVGPRIVLAAGENYEVPQITLRIGSANTSVQVVFSRHDLAEEQVKAEEKQRVLGVFPNFYISYVWNAEPLTTKQKFQLAWRTSIDPVTFAISGIVAGIEQWQNYFSGYGQGSEGYAKRFGASYGDAFIGTMIGGAILPAVLHQDPRYYYKGTGSVWSRSLYAISTVVITKGDNGRWQPNYSNVLGNLAAAGISNTYYPPGDRTGAQVTIDNALIGTASGAVSALLQEFLIKKISRGVPSSSSVQPTSSVQP